MSIPSLTPLSTPPGRTADDFDDAMPQTLTEVDNMVDQLNEIVDAINTILPALDEVPTQSATASGAASTATAAATTATTKADEAAASAVLAGMAKTGSEAARTDAEAARDEAVDAAQQALAGGIPAGIGTAAGDLIYYPVAGAPQRLGIGTQGQALLVGQDGLPYWGDVISGAQKWSGIAVEDYTATPASSSTVTMLADRTAIIRPGMALRYSIGGTVYYGICTAISANLLTVAGAPLTGDVTSLDYSIFPGMVEIIQLMIPGYWADTADTSIILNDLVQPVIWGGPPAALVTIQARTRTTDTGGSTYPRINARIGATTTDRICTSNSTAGLEIAASTTWYTSVVDIDPTQYMVNTGDTIELTTDANGGNDNASDIVVVLRFVYS
ncbi:MAG: hypothetical protein AB7D37_05695 [Desulfovibrio sp.]